MLELKMLAYSNAENRVNDMIEKIIQVANVILVETYKSKYWINILFVASVTRLEYIFFAETLLEAGWTIYASVN